MNYQIISQPTFSLVEFNLEQGESILSEAGAMAWMSSTITTKTSTRGGIMSGLSRLVAGESFFQNTFTAEKGPGLIGLAPGCPGDIVAIQMPSDGLMLERGAYLASDHSVNCDAKWDGMKGLFNEGLFILRCTGQGLLCFNAYGSVEEVDVDGEYVVDNGYAVAWEPSLQYRLSKARKIRSFLFSDQILLRFSGQGRLWIQSRNPQALASWVHPFRRVKKSNN